MAFSARRCSSPELKDRLPAKEQGATPAAAMLLSHLGQIHLQRRPVVVSRPEQSYIHALAQRVGHQALYEPLCAVGANASWKCNRVGRSVFVSAAASSTVTLQQPQSAGEIDTRLPVTVIRCLFFGFLISFPFFPWLSL